jgi:autotransporter-associated beta strand protein
VVGATGTASVTITNATVTTSSDVSLGNVPGTVGALTLNNGATLNVGSWFTLSDSPGSSGTVTMNNGSTLNVNNGRLFLCSAPGTIDTFNINGGVINKSGDYFAVVNGGWNGTGARTGVVNQVSGTVNSSSEMWVGDGGGPGGNDSLGIYNLSGGTLTVNNWFGVGRDGSQGIFNLSGTGVLNRGGGGDMVIGRGGDNTIGTFNMTGGTLTKTGGNPIIIGQNSGHGLFIQSGGTLSSDSEYWVGVDGNTTDATNIISGTAVFNINNWLSLGRGGSAFFNFSGGNINKSSGGNFIVGDGGTATFTQSGGTNNTDGELWIAQSGSGVGQYNISGGVLTAHNWLAVGREGGHGILNISGGSITKDGNGNISICHGGGAQGTVNQTGGSFTCAGGETWIGEDSGPGIWNISAGTATFGYVQLARNGDATGTLNLNGGTVTAGEITTGSSGTSTLNLNGGTLAANTSTVNFLHGLTAANVQSGVVIDSGSNTVGIAQSLLNNGAGGLTKVGSGTVYLNGANTYIGSTLVNAGALGGTGSIVSPVSVASGATLAPGTAAIGTLTINNSLTFAAGSKAAVKISMDGGATNDVVIGLTGVSYAGTLTVTNIGASPLVVGTQFQLFNAASISGNFANAASVTILPAGAGTFNPATGKLTITSAGAPVINPVKISGGNLILTGNGGTPGAAYAWLTTTNVANPIATWTTNLQSVFDGAGAFSNAIPITTSTPSQFFRLRTP